MVTLLFAIAATAVFYSMMTNRHKAIAKTYVLQKIGFLESNWIVYDRAKTYKMISPEFLIDRIYKSMEGPKASNYVELGKDSSVIFITGFKVKALDANSGEQISNDFICHTNVDFNDASYYSSFDLKDRIGVQYPRMTSLSHGLEEFGFPQGYGVPMKANEWLFVTTQTLNHNLPNINQKIKHEVSIQHTYQRLKPLMSRTVFIQLPYNKNDPFKGPLDPASNQCIPVETKNHSYNDGHGNMLSGHWVVPVGENSYQSSITDQLKMGTMDSLRLHAAAIHVHPFATEISIVDKTSGKQVFMSKIINHIGSIGLTKIEPLVSEGGVWLYKNHEYSLVLKVNNTSRINQDMMGSMFLFFYDKELDGKLSGI